MTTKQMTVADLRKQLNSLQKELKALPQSRKMHFLSDEGGYTDDARSLVAFEFDGKTLIVHSTA